jgi:hypothetical protein
MKFPAAYVTAMFITVFKKACHVSLSWTRPIQSTSSLRVYVPSTPRSSKWSAFLASPVRAALFDQFNLHDSNTQIIFGEEGKLWSSELSNFCQSPVISSLLEPTYILQHSSLEHIRPLSLGVWETKFHLHITKLT